MSTSSDIQHIIEELSNIDLVQGLSNLLDMAEGVIPENINDMTHELIKRHVAIKWPSLFIYYFMLSKRLDEMEKNLLNKKPDRAVTITQGQKKGKWMPVPSSNGDRDFIWWKCSECGLRIYSESEHDRKTKQRYCSRCGAVMWE